MTSSRRLFQSSGDLKENIGLSFVFDLKWWAVKQRPHPLSWSNLTTLFQTLVIVNLQKHVRLLALCGPEFLEADFFPTAHLVKGHALC